VYGRPPGDRGGLSTGGCDRRAVCFAPGGSATPVPRLAGLSPHEAVRALALAGLGARVRRRGPHGGLPRVTGERPRAGRAVARESTIELTVSGG